jgi:hypothetical protein
MSVEWFSINLKNIFIPLYVGTLFYSLTVPAVVCYAVNYLWKFSVHKERYSMKDEND